MKQKRIVFLAPNSDLANLLTPEFRSTYSVQLLSPDHLPEQLEAQADLLVVAGYSLQELYKLMPGSEAQVADLAERVPRLYLLESADPSLSLVPLKGERRFFYLRGPLSLRTLRNAVERILAMRPRPLRFPLSPEQGIHARFTLHTPNHKGTQHLKIIDEISPTGFSFQWEASAPLIYPGDVLESLELRAHDRLFLFTTAQVKHLTPLREAHGGYSLRVGAEFIDPDLSSADGGRPDGSGQAFLSDPLVIRSVIADAVERRTDALVSAESQSWSQRGIMAGFDALLHEIRLEMRSPLNPEELHRLDILTVQFVRDNARMQFSSVVLSLNHELQTLTLRLPRRLDKLWARSSLRYTYDADTAPQVEVHSPINPGWPMQRRIQNLSPNGLSFAADAQRDLLFKGMRLDRIDVLLPNGPRISVAAEVRYMGTRVQDGPQETISCGVRFLNVNPSDHSALVTYLITKSFPMVKDATLSDEASLWKFLLDGEFYTPSKQEQCLGTPEDVRETQRKMLLASPGLSRKLIVRDRGELYGTVSLQQVYSQTWLVHHLCASRHPTEFVPKHLLLFLGEYISKTPEVQYIKMMWRPNNSWSNKMFGRLVHRLHDGEQSVVKVYSYLHRPEGPLSPLARSETRWEIRPIASEEVLELESYFIHQEEFFLMKSEDLLRGQLGLETLDSRYRALGLFRERRTLVARDQGQIVGFCLLERSSPGLNMSNLLNAFQVFVNPRDSAQSPSLRRALIRSAVAYYQSLGQGRTVALTTDLALEDYESLGFSKVKEYVAWTFDHNIANIYNLYCYYIFRLYERLEAKRQVRRAFYQGAD